MIISKRKKTATIEIDLSGQQGNAFYLLGLANNLSKKLNLNADIIQKEMMESDYENLIQVFDKYFGSIVTLYRQG
jgi:hypothetical protein